MSDEPKTDSIFTKWVEDEDARYWYEEEGRTDGPVWFWLKRYGHCGPFVETLGGTWREDDREKPWFDLHGKWSAYADARPQGLFGASPGTLLGRYDDLTQAMAVIEDWVREQDAAREVRQTQEKEQPS